MTMTITIELTGEEIHALGNAIFSARYEMEHKGTLTAEKKAVLNRSFRKLSEAYTMLEFMEEQAAEKMMYNGVLITKKNSGYHLHSPINGTLRIFKSLDRAKTYVDHAEVMEARANAIMRD